MQAGQTAVKENELILLDDPAAATTSGSSNRDRVRPNSVIDVASEYRHPPRPARAPPVERVQIWNCCHYFCVTKNKTMNKVIRGLIITLTILLWMFSLTILGIGIWLIVDPKSYEPSRFLDTYQLIHAAYIMIITGGFTLFLAKFGIVATVMQNTCMLIIYLVFLLICFGMQVAIVTLAIMRGYGNRLYIFAYKELLRELQQYNFDGEARKFIDFFQVKLRCCGVESFNDYPRYGMAIPVSCYMAGHTYLNEKGCALALRRFLELRTAVVGFLSFFDGLVHILIIILIFLLIFVKRY